MQLNINTRQSKVSKVIKLTIKIILPILLVLLVIHFVGKIEMPSPNKLIKQVIPNDKLTIVK